MTWRSDLPLSAPRMPMLDTGVGLLAGAVKTVPATAIGPLSDKGPLIATGPPSATGTGCAESLMTSVFVGGGAACSGCATRNGTAQSASTAHAATARRFIVSLLLQFVPANKTTGVEAISRRGVYAPATRTESPAGATATTRRAAAGRGARRRGA